MAKQREKTVTGRVLPRSSERQTPADVSAGLVEMRTWMKLVRAMGDTAFTGGRSAMPRMFSRDGARQGCFVVMRFRER